MRVAYGRSEHLRPADQAHASDAAKALVEANRVKHVDPVPVALEALGPRVQGRWIVAAQVFDVDHFKAAAFHLDDRVGQARDPAAGEDVLANEEFGLGNGQRGR